MLTGDFSAKNPSKQKSKRKTKPRPKRRSTTSSSGIASTYARMLASPCDAKLAQGLYGDAQGLLARFRKSEDNNSLASCGYLLWCPDYHGKSNLVCFVDDNPAFQPLNTAEMAFGSGGEWVAPSGTTASFLRDPCETFVSQEMCADARVISSCMQLTYYGTQLNAGGELRLVENLRPEMLLNGGTNSKPASVNDIMNYAGSSMRLGTKTYEIRSRPTESSRIFRNHLQGTYQENAPEAVDEVQTTQNPKYYGFVWRNIPVDQTNLSFSLFKNIEWRPSPSSGLNRPTAIQSPVDPSKIVVAELDRKTGGSWTRTIGDVVDTVGKGINLISRIQSNPLVQQIESVAPLLLTMG